MPSVDVARPSSRWLANHCVPGRLTYERECPNNGRPEMAEQGRHVWRWRLPESPSTISRDSIPCFSLTNLGRVV